MIRVLFFARLREQLGCDRLDLEWSDALGNVAALREHLQGRAGWREPLGGGNILCAVNQQQAEAGQVLRDGDEVAFYPPVTGG